MDKEQPGLKAEFNRLSFIDRTTLRSFALMRSVTSIIRDDTKAHPWRYPFYILYLGALLMPGPSGTLPLLGLTAVGAWAAMKFAPKNWWVRERLSNAFNEEALMSRNSAYIAPHGKKPDVLKLDRVGLARATASHALENTRKATHFAMADMRRLFGAKPPTPENP